MVVVHQQISQLNSSGLTIVNVHRFKRYDKEAFGCIEGLDLMYYQVGVVRAVRASQTKSYGENM